MKVGLKYVKEICERWDLNYIYWTKLNNFVIDI